ncbi:MAG: PepSY-associated TM helix domain-containing protein [Agriterribacter sp.]
MTAKKIIGTTHLWLGLTSGLVVFILGLTGCLLAFEYEIKDAIYKDRYFTQPQQSPKLSLQQLLPLAQQAIGKAYPINSIDIDEANNRTIAFSAAKENPDGWNYFNALEYSYVVYLNPYTGKVLKVENAKIELFRVILIVHYDLLLEQTGKKIIGWSTVVFIVMLLTGLILWWPKNKAAARQRFSFKWKKTTKWKRKNYDLHNILGFYALIFALLIALTGLVWAFPAFDNSVQWIANGGESTETEKTYTSDTTNTSIQYSVYDAILGDMKNRNRNDNIFYIGIPEAKKDAIYGYSEEGRSGYHWTTYSYDQYTGKNLDIKYYKDKQTGEKLRNMNYFIHTGTILGLPGKILAFIVSFICSGLPITGFYIWWGRRKKNVSKRSVITPSHALNKRIPA